MSKQFKFRDDSLKLNIEGHDFTIIDIYNPHTAKTLAETGEKLININFENKDADEIQKTINDIVKEVTTILLGQDAFEKIFNGRNVKISEAIQLFDFLNEEITEHKANSVMNKYE